MNELITVFFWVCIVMVPVFLVMAYNQEIDQRTVARSIPTDATINRIFYAQTKGHPLYVTILYPKNPSSFIICNVDVLLQTNPADLFVGETVKIVRNSSDCDVPLLVDYIASPIKTLKFTLTLALVALALFLIQFLRTCRAETQR